MYKLGWFPDGVTEEQFAYSNVWAHEKTSGPSRLVLAPAANQCELLLKLSEQMAAPFLLLYVLVVTRGEGEEGRYQSADELDRDELSEFFKRHATFLERDARAHIWLLSADGNQLIYDRHNVIYAYGPINEFEVQAQSFGLSMVDKIRFPDPHAHHYRQEFDDQSKTILSEREWILSPLRPND